MSRLFGPVQQVGYFVPDVDRAMRHWIDALGVGPFFTMPTFPVQNYEYAGRRSDPVLSVGIAYSGPVQIELIQPLDDTPSLYREICDGGLPGPHYVSYWLRSLEPRLGEALASGFELVQSGGAEGAGRFRYLRHPAVSTLVELFEVTDFIEGLFNAARDASMNWDGTDPIRPVM